MSTSDQCLQIFCWFPCPMDVSSKRRRCVESSALQHQAMPGDGEGHTGRPLGVVKTIGVKQVRNLACIANAHVILQALSCILCTCPVGTNSGSKSVPMSPQSGMVKSWGLKVSKSSFAVKCMGACQLIPDSIKQDFLSGERSLGLRAKPPSFWSPFWRARQVDKACQDVLL